MKFEVVCTVHLIICTGDLIVGEDAGRGGTGTDKRHGVDRRHGSGEMHVHGTAKPVNGDAGISGDVQFIPSMYGFTAEHVD